MFPSLLILICVKELPGLLLIITKGVKLESFYSKTITLYNYYGWKRSHVATENRSYILKSATLSHLVYAANSAAWLMHAHTQSRISSLLDIFIELMPVTLGWHFSPGIIVTARFWSRSPKRDMNSLTSKLIISVHERCFKNKPGTRLKDFL